MTLDLYYLVDRSIQEELCSELDQKVLLLKAKKNGLIGQAEFDTKVALLKQALSHRSAIAEFREGAETMQQVATLLLITPLATQKYGIWQQLARF